MNVFDKLKWILGIALVFSLILLTNRSDRQTFARLSDNMRDMYDDRIVAYDLLFKMKDIVHDLHVGVDGAPGAATAQDYAAKWEQLDAYVEAYRATALTPRESATFTDLTRRVGQFRDSFEASGDISAGSPDSPDDMLTGIDETLKTLTEIQLAESRGKMMDSQKVSERFNLFSRIEIYVLIAMALIVQVVILYQPARKEHS